MSSHLVYQNYLTLTWAAVESAIEQPSGQLLVLVEGAAEPFLVDPIAVVAEENRDRMLRHDPKRVLVG